ncbi:HAD-IA family hydrolase [Streptomyces sp. TRM66268-LWL]|uniref:HAD-IA family hydrolase n=1 Tax=Streptomyces polyasparticus TaxID=2767826 RepID=A0ABR7SUH5_9ACTN|nr:HAD-IA family hydrolase [Streptomyces polyasparticus]MBC9718003.1 HAD-IA family hydrolase [Streptomyces polyasparticus]
MRSAGGESAAPQNGLAALLLDFDGVIIDSEYAHYMAWREEFERFGLWLATDTWAEHWASGRTLGAPRKQPVTALLEARLGRPLEDAVAERVRARYVALRDALPLRPGIAAWIKEGTARGLRCAVVTDGSSPYVQTILDRLGLADDIALVVGRSAHRTAKPAPDGYRDALTYLNITGEQAVAVEDSPHGVAAARAAGLPVIATPNRVTSPLLAPAPKVVIADPQLMTLGRSLALLDPPERSARPRARPTVPPVARIRGCLAGIGLGDALGKVIDKRTRTTLDPETTDMLDAFAKDTAPPAVFSGRITDDTVLTLAVAASIGTLGLPHRDALEAKLRHINPHGGRQIYKLRESEETFALATDGDTNGCVARSAALAALHTPDDLGELAYDTLKTATLTHGDPEAIVAALLFAVALCHAFAGDSTEDTVRALHVRAPKLVRLAGGGRKVAEHVLAHAPAGDGVPYSPAEYIDELEETVGLGVRARSSAVAGILLGLSGIPARDLVPALLQRRHGGDLDSVAALACGLTYAFHPEEVPEPWVTRVERYAKTSFQGTASALDGLRAKRTR